MNPSNRRTAAAALAVVLMTTVMASCATSAPGRRCVAGAAGQDSTHLLVCKNGRWRRSKFTRFDALKAFFAQYGGEALVRGITLDRNPSTPATPDAPTVVRADNPTVSAIGVTWTAPADNGFPITAYQVRGYRNGETIPSINVTVSDTAAIIATIPGSTYQVTVAAANSQGESLESARSAEVVAFVRPGAVTSATVAATGVSGEVAIVPTGATPNGKAIDAYWVIWLSDLGFDSAFVAPDATGTVKVGGLTNGDEHSFVISACNLGEDTDYCGEGFATDDEIPYGPPSAPSVGAVAGPGTGVTLTWGGALPNGRPVDRVELSIDNGPWQAVAASGTLIADTGCEVVHKIAARAFSLDAVSIVAKSSATSAACS